VFIGAGPANLAAANILLGSGIKNVLILEEGSPFSRRACPGQRHGLCTYCNGGLCHVSGGEGGSSAKFGNKLCYFPASDGILDFFDEDVVKSSSDYLDDLLDPCFDSRCSHRGPSPLAEYSQRGECRAPYRKTYLSRILLRHEFEQLIHRLLASPRKAAIIRYNTAVSGILKAESSFFTLLTGKGETIEAKNVLLGCGRSSHAFLRRVFDSLKVEWEESCQDVGIRLEGPSALFAESFTYQVDPKYKFAHLPYGTSRTFCGCQGGIIVPVKFGQSFYADGAFGDMLTNRSNVALMVRSREPVPADALEQWCNTVNESAGGNLLLGKVSLSEINTGELVSAVMALIPQWPSAKHQTMMTELLTLSLGDPVSLLNFLEAVGKHLCVYGPAIDLYWPKPKLKGGLETNVPGLFVVGDTTGVSRGFVQAMISGTAWAMAHLGEFSRPNIIHSSQKEAIEWSVSV